MWGKGEGTLLEKGCLLPSSTPPPLIPQRLLTGGEAARRESPVSLLIKIGKGRSKHFERPFVWARERKEVRGRDRMRQMILKEISV
jgi:hypothetical protein